MQSKEEIFSKLREILVEMFNFEPEKIQLSARLVQDLDIDSIDAIDLLVEMEDHIDQKPDPQKFKQIRTLQDLVNVLYELVNQGAPG
jgi:acyl carrier protein